MVKYIIIVIIMERFMRKLIFVCILVIFALTNILGMSVSAAERSYADDKIFTVSRGGETAEFPKNSIEAIEACFTLCVDAVSANVRKTSDGKLVLSENDSTKGFLVDENGESTDVLISETDYETLSSYFLLSSENENLSRKTESKIVLLSDALNTVKGKLFFIIDCEEEILDDVYNEVLKSGSLESVFFRSRKMKNDDFLTWANSKTEKTSFIPTYRGNVIFSAISTYSFAENNSTRFCEFTTKNRYGVIFSDFFTNRFDHVTALAPVYDTELSGNRPDSVLGWESLIKSGYSAIETENAKELSDYISLLNTSYSQLERVYNEANEIDLSSFSDESTKDFLKHLQKAEEILKLTKASSQDEINSCIENIKLSSRDFEKSQEDSTSAFSVTPMKIFWIAFALILFASSQLYLYKKTKKS